MSAGSGTRARVAPCRQAARSAIRLVPGRQTLRDGIRLVRVAGAVAAALTTAACAPDPTGTSPPPPPPPPGPGPAFSVETVAAGLDQPLLVTAPDGDERLFIVEQSGRIRILAGGQVLDPPFLDLSASVASGSEQGLLGLAFHPSYGTNGFFYVDYTDPAGRTIVERYTVSANPDAADASSAREILRVDQPFTNHNGGQLLFGPDGKLYVFLGDGGSAGDPLGSGQDRSTLLGSILRLDVDGGDPYAIPADNPFVGEPGVREEIWAYGLRNPWRSWFDTPSGTLFVADVGQSRIEEVNAVAASSGGVNYGWNTMEGSECFGSGSCDRDGLTLPIDEYTHADGCSVTGGVVYRGSIPELAGHYLYSDFCTGFLRSFRLVGGEAVDRTEWDLPPLGGVSSFGVDADGEVYIVDLFGRVLRLVAAGP